MRFSILWTALLGTVLMLAGCGGGGGGGGRDSAAPGSDVVVSGTAAKGLIANALVSSHAIRADGTVDSTPLASTTTDANGRYNLNFRGTVSQPYVLSVAAQASTTHADEVTGQSQPLPVGFVLRSVLTAGAAPVKANVTPFSEMVVSAALKASGGINAANTRLAASTVQQLFGFDPVTADIKSTTDAITPEEQKLAIMLTAISQLSNSGAMNCDTGSAGAKTQCVVERLSGAASANTMDLTTGAINVSGALSTAITTVLNTPALAGTVPRTLLSVIQENLNCAATNSCTPARPVPTGTTAEAIAAAKSLFTEIKSDWTTLFRSGTTVGTGDARAELQRFGDAMGDVQAPVEMTAEDAAAIVLGMELYDGYFKNSARTSASRGVGLVANDSSAAAVGCSLYSDSNFSMLIPAGTPPSSAAVYVGCSTRYYVSYSFLSGAVRRHEWRHSFGITPTTTPGNFTYTARTQRREFTSPFGASFTNVLLATPRTGTASATFNSAGKVESFTMAGQMPPAFKSGSNMLAGPADSYIDWNLSGTRSYSVTTGDSTTVTGSVQAKGSDGATLATLAITNGAFTEAMGIEGLDFGVTWSTAQASFAGRITASEPVTSASGQERRLTKVVLDGKLSNVSGTAQTDFLTGKLTASVQRFDQYNEAVAASATNYYSTDVRLLATATAPNRPVLQMIVGTSLPSYQEEPTDFTLQYRSIVAGTPRMTVNITSTLGTNQVRTTSLSEVSSGISMSVVGSPADADLVLGTTKLGVLNRNNNILTFTDGSFISVEIE